MDRKELKDFLKFLVNSRLFPEGYNPDKVIDWYEKDKGVKKDAN